MTPDEREQLRRDLEAAGCEKLSRTVAWAHWNMPAAAIFMRELRSLLRREVVVVTDWARDEIVGVCSSESQADRMIQSRRSPTCDVEVFAIDAEVPDEPE